MKNRTKIIQFVLAAIVVVAVALIIVVRNSVSLPESLGEHPQTGPSEKFALPSRTNVNKSFAERVAALKKSVNENPENADHLIALAQLLMDGHQNNDAIVYFEKAALLRPKDDSLLLDLSVCYFNAKEYDKALATSENILSANPSHSRALYNKGSILATLQRKKEAVAVWKDLIRRAPGSEEAKTVRGYISQMEQP